MAAIKSKNTKPEIAVRKQLHKRGLRYRLNAKDLPGKPDLVFPKFKTVVFVNGCFWHGHGNCAVFRLPKSNTEWWREKIEKTRARDRKKTADLTALGWRVLTIWQCGINDAALEALAHDIRFGPA